MLVRNWMSVVAVGVGMGAASVAMAQVTGTVKLEGEAPEMEVIDMSGVPSCNAQHADPVFQETVVVGDNNELANVVVSIKSEEGMDLGGEAPKEPAVLDQKGCMYSPHVIAMMVGQELVVKNSDPFMHNVHSLPKQNPAINFAQPNIDPGKPQPAPKVPETYPVKCDVHPWMSAWVRVFDHPFFAVSGMDGKYSIANVPDGEYTFVAWHEKFGETEQKAEVKDGKAEINFTFKTQKCRALPFDGGVQLMANMPPTCEPESCFADKAMAALEADEQAEKAKSN